MSKDKNKITSKQLATLIISSQIGVGILTLPPVLAEKTGHDGWIAVLLSGIASLPVVVIIVILARRYKDKSLVKINYCLYGTYLGHILNFVFIIYLSAVTSLILRIFVEVIKINVLRVTPGEVITLFNFLPAIYMARYGFKAIARFANEVYLIVPIVLLYFFSITKEMRLTYLMPIGDAGIVPIMKGIFVALPMFLGIELIPLMYSKVKDNSKTLKYVILGHTYSTLFFTIVVAVSTLVYGETLLKIISFPLFLVFRIYKSTLFERVDLFFNAIWLPAMGTTSLVYYYSGFYSIKEMFQVKKERWPFVIYTAAIMLASRVPEDYAHTQKLLGLLGYLGMGMFVFLIFSTIFSFINKRGVAGK
jgi:spore germination protein (amino acid permease)